MTVKESILRNCPYGHKLSKDIMRQFSADWCDAYILCSGADESLWKARGVIKTGFCLTECPYAKRMGILKKINSELSRWL